jgi:hypothetical protein
MPRLRVRTAKTRIPVRSNQVSGKKQGRTVVPGLDLTWLEPAFEDTRPQPITAATDEAVSETPEFFDLRPLTSQPVAVILRETGPASFYFVGEGRGSDEMDSED